MDITILRKYDLNKNNLNLHRLQNPEGMSMTEIQDLETALNHGNPFPKAFREYLYIGGKYNALGFNTGLGDFKGMDTYYKKKVKARGLKIDRPYLIIDSFEGYIFMFIYLDEGDNPTVWFCSIDEDYDSEDGKSIWKLPDPNFSALVDDLVNKALKGLTPW